MHMLEQVCHNASSPSLNNVCMDIADFVDDMWIFSVCLTGCPDVVTCRSGGYFCGWSSPAGEWVRTMSIAHFMPHVPMLGIRSGAKCVEFRCPPRKLDGKGNGDWVPLGMNGMTMSVDVLNELETKGIALVDYDSKGCWNLILVSEKTQESFWIRFHVDECTY